MQLREINPRTVEQLEELPPAQQRSWLLCLLLGHDGRVEQALVAKAYQRLVDADAPASGVGALLGELVDLGIVETMQRRGDGYVVRLSNGWRD